MTPDTLSPEVVAELAKLRDIRVPDPVGWWPLASGWWMLLAFCLTAIFLGVVFEIRRRHTLRFAAIEELRTLKSRLTPDSDLHQVAVDLAVLLRRIMLNTDKRQVLPGLSGDGWADELADGENGLSSETAALLTQAPYAPAFGQDLREKLVTAFSESERWIRRNA